MRCTGCKDSSMVDAFTTYFSNTNGCYIIIEKVPCKKCSQCGEEVFSATVMEQIDRMISNITQNQNKVCITEYKKSA